MATKTEKFLSIRVPFELLQEYKKYIKENGMNLKGLVILSINEYIKNHPTKNF